MPQLLCIVVEPPTNKAVQTVFLMHRQPSSHYAATAKPCKTAFACLELYFKKVSHQPADRCYMRLTFRKSYFTFWHYRRTPAYTASNRARMAEDKATYLDQLERWLNYEHELDSPLLADGVAGKQAGGTEARKRVDSFVDDERSKMAREVARENELKNAAKSKRIADLGKVSRLEVLFPLPSCAQEEGDEQFAGGAIGAVGSDAGLLRKVKNVLGINSTPSK